MHFSHHCTRVQPCPCDKREPIFDVSEDATLIALAREDPSTIHADIAAARRAEGAVKALPSPALRDGRETDAQGFARAIHARIMAIQKDATTQHLQQLALLALGGGKVVRQRLRPSEELLRRAWPEGQSLMGAGKCCQSPAPPTQRRLGEKVGALLYSVVSAAHQRFRVSERIRVHVLAHAAGPRALSLAVLWQQAQDPPWC